MTRLTRDQVIQYHRDGFLAPVDALPPGEIAALRAGLEAFEASLPAGPVPPMLRRKLHVRLPWMRDLIEDPRIVDVVESVIGPDILVFNATFFIKEPGSGAITAWHQDATYFGLEPHEHITAWLAFSDASVEAGCMQFARGSHLRGQLRHATDTVGQSVNHGSQSIAQAFDDSDLAHGPLKPGQISLHHTLVVHRSAPNGGRDRRIGLGISYIPTRVRHRGSYRMGASLVRGTDHYGHFELEPDPRRLGEAEAVAAHEQAYRRYREGYDEQVRAHAMAFA